MMSVQVEPVLQPRLASVAEMSKMEPYRRLFSNAALRHLIFNSAPVKDSRGRRISAGNGLVEAGALIRIGRKVLFDLDRFDAWILSHRVTN